MRPGPDRLDRQEGQIRRPGHFGAGLVQAAARGEKVEQVILGQEKVGVPRGFEPRVGATAVGGVLIAVTVDDVDRRIGKGRCQPRQGMFGQPVPGTNWNQDVGGAGADPAPGIAPACRGREGNPDIGRSGSAGRFLQYGTPVAVRLPLKAVHCRGRVAGSMDQDHEPRPGSSRSGLDGAGRIEGAVPRGIVGKPGGPRQ